MKISNRRRENEKIFKSKIYYIIDLLFYNYNKTYKTKKPQNGAKYKRKISY